MTVLHENINNPYLEKYYQDQKRWAFHSQIRFLIHSLEQQKEIMNLPGMVIEDRTIHEDVFVFAKSLYKQDILDKTDWQTYLRLFKKTYDIICYPDLLVYLKVNDIKILIDRIKKRSRKAEAGIPVEYLTMLNERYHNFFKNYRGAKIIINAEKDMSKDKEFFNEIVYKIVEKINELKD